MRLRHDMPFSAVVDGGQAHLRLWAPAAISVHLDLTHNGAPSRQALEAEGDGRFSIRLPDVGTTAAGDVRYRYRIDDRIDVPDPASRSNPDDVRGASALWALEPADARSGGIRADNASVGGSPAHDKGENDG